MELAKKQGAKRVIPLKTSGPFHTIQLEEAAKVLQKELQRVSIQPIEKWRMKIMKNIDGTEYTSKDNVKSILVNHVISPVQFSKCIKQMINLGVDTFVEIGPGTVLSGFVKKIDSTVKVDSIHDKETLENRIKEWK